ncbi:MAG: hypothetical protein K2J47_09965 [Ruminococcus sp.]|nr:hypothetical protein [Ruminococcus sp.]
MLLTKAALHKPTHGQIYSGAADIVTEQKILEALFKIAVPSISDLSKDDARNYKSCKGKGSRNLRTNDGTAGKLLNEKLNDNYAECHSKMKQFINKYIDTDNNQDEWLVYAILELIENDVTIDDEQPFYIGNSNAMTTKRYLLSVDRIDLPAFLLGIFLFVLTEIKDNTVGKETYESWCPVTGEKHDRRIFDSAIGSAPKRHILIEGHGYELSAKADEAADNSTDNCENTIATAKSPPIYDSIIRSAKAAFPILIAAINALGSINEDELQSFLSQSYYQLIITNSEIHGAKHVDIPLERGLNYGRTPAEIKERCGDLSKEGIDELLSYPAIICNENVFHNGKTDENQLAILARLTKIKKGETDIRIRFFPLATFFQKQLNEYAVDLGLSSGVTLTTLNTTHWTVRKKNLFEEFEDVEIPFCRYTLLYKSSVLQTDVPTNQTKILVTDFKKFNIGCYTTVTQYMSISHLDNDRTYRYTGVFEFKNIYVEGKRFIRMSTLWNKIYITGDLSTENWTSQSYMNNYANAGSGKVTAIFKVLNYATKSVHFLLIMEVKDE